MPKLPQKMIVRRVLVQTGFMEGTFVDVAATDEEWHHHDRQIAFYERWEGLALVVIFLTWAIAMLYTVHHA